MDRKVKKNITIYDIAKAANVSPTTVSRVLTRNPLVKESTRKLVLEKMRELDYTLNEAARSLTTRQTNLIGFILPDITNPFFSQVYIEVEKRALEKGYTILLRNSMSLSDMETIHLREFSERRVESIVFMGGRINKVNPDTIEISEVNEVSKKVPLIMLNGKIEGVDCYTISTDEEKGTRLLVEYLVSLGHKKIGLIGGIEGVSTAEKKVLSFQQTLHEYNLTFQPQWQIYSDFGIEGGSAAMKKLLEQDELPTAIMGMNDMVIYGALRECREQGVSMEDFSFAGYDDIFPSAIVHPSLTTVNHNYEVFGNEIVKMIDRISEGKQIEKDILIDTQLIIRDSCKKVDE